MYIFHLVVCRNDCREFYCINSSLENVCYFQDKADEEITMTNASVSPGTQLVRKLVAVLENSEKLPLYIYDIPGAGSGLQVLSRRLRFRLERAPGESSLIDRNGRTLKVTPYLFNEWIKYIQSHLASENYGQLLKIAAT